MSAREVMREMREHRAPSGALSASHVVDGKIENSVNVTRTKRQIGCERLLQLKNFTS